METTIPRKLGGFANGLGKTDLPHPNFSLERLTDSHTFIRGGAYMSCSLNSLKRLYWGLYRGVS